MVLADFLKSRIDEFNPPSSQPGVTLGRVRALIPCALFLQGVVALSPILAAAGVRGMYIYALVYLITFYEILFNKKTLPLACVYLCAAVFIGSGLAGLYWQDAKAAFVSLFFIGSILITGVADRQAVDRFITICTYFFMAILVLCWIGFFYVLHGGEGLLTMLNPDGRENILYLTTFSNYRVLNTIRPSGIFDEPGALSFLVCALAALRMLYKRNVFVSILLLQLGTVVFGFTHYAFFALFLLFMDGKSIRFRMVLILAVVLVNYLEYLFLKDAIHTLFLWKFNYQPETGTISGDNRSAQVSLTRSTLTLRSFLWGLDPTAMTDIVAFRKKFGSMSENPLGPLVTTGVFVSFPYYCFMALFLLKGAFSRERRIYLAVALLFMPRPYVTSYGYSVFAMLFFLALLNKRSDPDYAMCIPRRMGG